MNRYDWGWVRKAPCSEKYHIPNNLQLPVIEPEIVIRELLSL